MAITRSQTRDRAPRKNFHLYPQLPPELQRLVWSHAVDNCFFLYRRIYRLTKEDVSSGRYIIKHRRNHRQTKTTRALCNKRWMRILLACQTSYDVGKKAEAHKLSSEDDKRYYWGRGMRWERETKEMMLEDGLEKQKRWMENRGGTDFLTARDAVDDRGY